MSVVPIERLRLNKQIQFERSLLRELTLQEVQQDVSQSFQKLFHSYTVFESAIQEEAVEQAMEAYLLGAEASQFILSGEQKEDVISRYEVELHTIAADFADYLDYWHHATESHSWLIQRAGTICEKFFKRWWMAGLERGERRRRLKLH